MAFWPDVKRGDKVQYHMVLENNLRHMVNSLNGFGAGNIAAPSGGVVKVQVWNASGTALVAGQPVAFDESKAMCGDALPAVKVTDVAKPWGVCAGYIEPNETGGCIVAGPATVSLSGSAGDYAEPVANGTGFTRAATGTARVLFCGTNAAVILLGGAGAMENYTGPFAITFDAETGKVNMAAGYATLNGEWQTVAGASITPQTGTICVCSTLENGAWSTPEVKFAEPGKNNYPIGTCKVEGSGETQTVSVCCCRVPVAVILDTDDCEKIGEGDE